MKHEAETILPYESNDQKSQQIERMFDAIAPDYDKLNRTMTMGIDIWWRRRAIQKLRTYSPRKILDVATGTGDLAFSMYRRLKPTQVTGIDLSDGMLDVARRKAARAGLQSDVLFEKQDCLSMSYEDASFNAVTVAFGVRNFEDIEAGFTEMYRVLAPGGVLMILELSTPRHFPFRQLYNLYSGKIIPLMGRLLSSDKAAYKYLPRSIEVVPQGRQMTDIFSKVGFRNARCIEMTFGTCSIYIGQK